MRRLLAAAGVLVAAIAIAVVATTRAQSSSGSYTVRAIFDDASYAANGEDVRIAGANVGSITSLAVNSKNRAAVTITIDNADFIPFYSNAHCTIRPQSVIGEEFVACSPGTSRGHTALNQLNTGPGKGEHFLPVSNTSSPIDSDIVQNISRVPVQQALSVVLDELGTGLATRGSDLNAVIHRANPALGETDKVFKILAAQNHQLAQLADDSQSVLAPLARERTHISGFVRTANTTSVAAAAKAEDEYRTFHLFPTFLSRLRPLLADLSVLSDKGTPVLQQLGQTAGPLGEEFGQLQPFAKEARTSLLALGNTAQQSEAPLVSSLPLVQELKALGLNAKPSTEQLLKLLTSLDQTGGYEQLMSLLYNATSVTNGFNSDGHYARAEPLNSNNTNYFNKCPGSCGGKFVNDAQTSLLESGSPDSVVEQEVVSKALAEADSATRSSKSIGGLLGYLTGNGGGSGSGTKTGPTTGTTTTNSTTSSSSSTSSTTTTSGSTTTNGTTTGAGR
jgi:ABC-type transporter Mla subunit MlaD